MKNGMMWGFVLITFLAVIHYDYGSDYMAYYKLYIETINSPFDFRAILAGDYFRDPGWVILCFLFKYLGGFFMLVAVLNIIQNVLIYKFIKRYCPQGWWLFGVFIYLFITSNYLMAFSMMRQSFVLAVILGLWPLIKERKWLMPLIVIGLCSFIHGSAIAFLPFAFWGLLPVKKTKTWAIVYGALFVALMVSSQLLNDVFEQAMAIEIFDDYADTYDNDENDIHYGVGFVLLMIPFVLSIITLMREESLTEDDKRLISLGAVASLVIPFGQVIQMVGRIGLYFSYFHFASLPIVYKSVMSHNKSIGRIVLFIYCFMTLYDYWHFFHSEIFAKPYATFHTIFEVL